MKQIFQRAGLSLGFFAVVALLPIMGLSQGQEKKPVPVSPEAAKFFETKVRPILAEHCFKCHGADKHKGNLRLDSLATILAGGDDGPAITPGQPEKSLLNNANPYQDAQPNIPPAQKLTREQSAGLTHRVKKGAP